LHRTRYQTLADVSGVHSASIKIDPTLAVQEFGGFARRSNR